MIRASDDDLRAAARAGGLHLELIGRGPTILCLHSSGLSGRQWRALAAELQTEFRVLMPDLFGYGESSGPSDPGEITTEDDMQALRPLVAALEEPVALVGHSFGGVLALLLAAERPLVQSDRVFALAAYEPVSFGVLEASPRLGLDADPAKTDLAAFGDDGDTFFELDDRGYEGWLRRFVEWWNGPGAWDAMRPNVQDTFRASQAKMHAEVRALLAAQRPLDHYLPVTAPSLFLCGARTREAAKAVCRRLGDRLPNARFETIDGAGHLGPVSHRDAVNAAIAQHLRTALRQ